MLEVVLVLLHEEGKSEEILERLSSLGCPSRRCHRSRVVETVRAELVCWRSPNKGYRSPLLLERRRRVRVARSFIEKPYGSNSMEQKLSRMNLRTEIRDLIMAGETRT
jgi:hypothetical protein